MPARTAGLFRISLEDRKIPVKDICRDLNISRATLYRYLKMDEKK